MEGRILGLNLDNSSYIIKADNGRRYSFLKEDWKSEKQPLVGSYVNFTIENGSKAINVILVPIEEKLRDNNNTKSIKELINRYFFRLA